MLKPDDIIYDDKKGEYKILKAIGSGGMGYILLVERVSDKQQFAVKTLSAVFIEGDSNYKALLNEGKLAEEIKHKNVIKYEYFHNGEAYPNLPPYIIMELAEEDNFQDLLNKHIESETLFKQEDILGLYFKLVDGMEAINTVLVHRDIKPANILFKDGELKISDFGIAKIAGDPTRTKSFKGSGTIPFFPPEAFLNKKNTIQMDIYSMGIVFYLIATLKHPYEIEQEIKNEDDWKNAHLYISPAPPQNLNKSVSPKIFSIIQKMIEKNPIKRFSSWEEIRKELKSIDKLKSATHSDVIEKMIAKKSEEKTKAQQEELEVTKRQEAENQKKQMIMYQFENDVLNPIKEFVEEYNSAMPSSEDKILVHEINSDIVPNKEKTLEVRATDLSFRVRIYIHIIRDTDCLEHERTDPFGYSFTKKTYPLLNQKEILAWGMVEENMGKGFNIVLVKSDTSEYGEWFLLKNTNSALVSGHNGRPEPFPFNLTEIKEEIHHVNAMHVYNTQILPFNPQIIIDFISEF